MVPETIKELKGKKKVAALSLFARESVKASGIISKLPLDRLDKSVLGIPLPSNNIFWSVTHKLDFVAGVVSTGQIGIDIEQIKDVSNAVFERIVDPEEKKHFSSNNKALVFFRAFTAKEAVLKKTGHGIRGLSKAKIKMVVDDQNLVVQYLNQKYLVENFSFDGYLASVTKDNVDVKWIIR